MDSCRSVSTQQDALQLPEYNHLSLSELKEVAVEIQTRFALCDELVQWPEDLQKLVRDMLIQLSQNVAQRLDRNPEKLMHQLYRMDVSEQKIKEAFAAFPARDLAYSIAYLILERQFQKSLLRQQAERFAPPEGSETIESKMDI